MKNLKFVLLAALLLGTAHASQAATTAIISHSTFTVQAATISVPLGRIDTLISTNFTLSTGTLTVSTLTVTNTITAATVTANSLLQGHGTSTNDDPPAGWIGEYKEIIVSSANTVGLTASSFVNIASTTLTPGDWAVSVTCAQFMLSATGTTTGNCAVSTSSGNVTTDHITGDNNATYPSVAATVPPTTTISNKRYKVAAGTTTPIFLKMNPGGVTGTPTGYGNIRARRER